MFIFLALSHFSHEKKSGRFSWKNVKKQQKQQQQQQQEQQQQKDNNSITETPKQPVPNSPWLVKKIFSILSKIAFS